MENINEIALNSDQKEELVQDIQNLQNSSSESKTEISNQNQINEIQEISHKECIKKQETDLDDNEQILKDIQQNSLEDFCYGCIVGAFIGDSCGSYLEFSHTIGKDEVMKTCLKMPGGGPFRLNPGQITDDSELAMSLMWGLIKGLKIFKQDHQNVLKTDQKIIEILNEVEKGKTLLNLDAISQYYSQWIRSAPFDVGYTTRNALSCLRNQPSYKKAQLESQKSNQDSQSNGSLMRITPLAIYLIDIQSTNEFFDIIDAETVITHPNIAVTFANFIYCKTIQYLIKNSQDPLKCIKAFNQAKELSITIKGKKQQNGDLCFEWIQQSEILFKNYQEKYKQGKSKSIDQDILTDYQSIRKQVGWIKHAFILSFYFLLRQTRIEDTDQVYCEPSQIFKVAMRETIRQGGDTDTNACIVGGMIGASVGIKNIPNHMVNKVVNFDCTDCQSRQRPDFLSVKKHLLKNIKTLINIRPQSQSENNQNQVIQFHGSQ